MAPPNTERRKEDQDEQSQAPAGCGGGYALAGRQHSIRRNSIQGNTAAPEEAPAQPVDNTPPKPVAPQITIDQVRTLLAEKSGEGKTQAVKALLYKYDAGKLSGVKPEDYAALMEEARKL